MTSSLKTKWQRLKYWQKGGVIGFIVGLGIVYSIINCSGETTLCWSLLLLTATSVMISNLFSHEILNPIFIFSVLIQYFLIGALIGLIIGKVKGR